MHHFYNYTYFLTLFLHKIPNDVIITRNIPCLLEYSMVTQSSVICTKNKMYKEKLKSHAGVYQSNDHFMSVREREAIKHVSGSKNTIFMMNPDGFSVSFWPFFGLTYVCYQIFWDLGLWWGLCDPHFYTIINYTCPLPEATDALIDYKPSFFICGLH